MKTLELVERKNTTESAKKAVIEFFNSIDLSAAKDVHNLESHKFSCHSKWNSGEFESVAFVNKDGKLGFICGNSENPENASYVFDDYCDYIDFKGMMSVFERFMNRLNEIIASKEEDIASFLDFYEGYKSYQHTIKNAAEFESNNEELK